MNNQLIKKNKKKFVFLHKGELLKRLGILSIMLLLLGFFLYKYYAEQNFLNNIKFSYVRDVYIPSLTYKIKNSQTAMVSSFFTSSVNSVSSDSQSILKFTEGNAKSVPVLLYHGVIENSDGDNILLEDFKNQMFMLKKSGWQTVSIEDFYKFMEGEKELPDKSFLLTFDDGRKDSYYPVDPILKALDYKAVMFVITGRSLGKGNEKENYHLSKEELKKMAKSGRWDIQAHTKEGHNFFLIDGLGGKGHFYSNKLWLEGKGRIETEEEFKTRIREDFISAKNDIKQNLGIDVLSFAFPFGDFGQESVNFSEAENIILNAIKEIYPISFYQVWPGKGFSFNYPDENQFLIKRIDVKPDWNADNLLKILDISRDKTIPYLDNFNDYNGWIKTWGELSLNNNSMILEARASTTGSAVFLDGSYLWKNYVFKADVSLVKGQTFSLMARYEDGKNYTACSFSDKAIKAEQILNGERKILSELKGDFVFIGRSREVGIGVYGDTVNCYLDGKIAMKASNLDQSLNHGGIGFKTWDKELNNSKLVVYKVDVAEIKQDGTQNLNGIMAEELPGNSSSISNTDTSNISNGKIIASSSQSSISSIASSSSSFSSSSSPAIKPDPKILPYKSDVFVSIGDWKNIYGKLGARDNMLFVGANDLPSASTTASMAILDGTNDWKDYVFGAKLDWLRGAGFSLVARYKDSKNYMYCSYSGYGSFVRIYLVKDGVATTLGKTARLPIPDSNPWKDLDFKVKVIGDDIECLINDEWILRALDVKEMPEFGGIGFKTWDPDKGVSNAAIKEISVVPLRQ